MPKKQEAVSIPKYLLNQLIEHTPGGFVLFYFNPENMYPEFKMTFDAPPYYLAMSKYIADWSKAMNNMQTLVAENGLHTPTDDDSEN